jgi:hypothetical protein
VRVSVGTRSGGGDFNLSDPVNSFADVVRRVVLSPTTFFAELPRRGNLAGPLVFALICIEISAILGALLGELLFLFGGVGGSSPGFNPTAAVTIVDPVNGIHSVRRSLSHPKR